MFTGIVQSTGKVLTLEPRGGDHRLTLDIGELAARIDAARLADGASLAVNGVCLTAIEHRAGQFRADLSRETLALTTLGQLRQGDRVNLEPALRAGDPLGGHLMSGHIDGCAEVVELQQDARSLRVELQVPPQLARYVAPKGSVALDGVSLTVNAVQGARFSVNLIPHTAEVTTFASLALGQFLNLEVDQMARYAERLLASRT